MHIYVPLQYKQGFSFTCWGGLTEHTHPTHIHKYAHTNTYTQSSDDSALKKEKGSNQLRQSKYAKFSIFFHLKKMNKRKVISSQISSRFLFICNYHRIRFFFLRSPLGICARNGI